MWKLQKYIMTIAAAAGLVCAGPVPKAKIPEANAKAVSAFLHLPLGFEPLENRATGEFVARAAGYSLSLSSAQAVLAVRRPAPQSSATLHMSVVGANASAKAVALDQLEGVVNYYLGNVPRMWKTNVTRYRKIRYKGIYPGIDLAYYGNQQKLEYDFVVGPGADPRLIALSIAGADVIRIDKGDLVLSIGASEIRFHKPAAYQGAAGSKSRTSPRMLFHR